MPKVVLTEYQRDREVVESVIKQYAGSLRITIPEVAKRARMPESTLYKRIYDPDTFRRGELKRICKVLKIPEEEKKRLL